MFYQLLYIHLYRPFLKYTKTTSPLPNHVSPRKFCTQAAAAISKLFRLYKRTHGLRQICNIAVYIAHSACTIHLLNLPDKSANRDVIHGVKQLEEIGEYWICARRTLRIVGQCVEKWRIDLPEEAQVVIQREIQRHNESEIPPAALSPMSMTNMTGQMQTQPVPDVLTQNFQYHQQMRHPSTSEASYSSPSLSSIPPSEGIPSMSHNIEQQHQDMNMIMPYIPEAHNPHKSKISLDLTQAQQDAWNALQTKMGHLTPSGTKTPNEQPVNAATMFGGVDSLIEESQDWWFQDQSQLALGFDNWNNSSSGWTPMNGSPNVAMLGAPDTSVQAPSARSNGSFSSSHSIHNGTGQGMPHSTSIMRGYPQMDNNQHTQHNLHAHMYTTFPVQALHHPRSQPPTSNTSPPPQILSHSRPLLSSGHKRGSYDDDLTY